ncbi:MAG: MerR family transcriptional regulator [Chloroflexota bacterium]|nr:MerR family transcriptional regulator [Dehalococcoidia bacterium]MDW8253920.1 MerR family transcriptional regulator [Chloroflexota bacterium]
MSESSTPLLTIGAVVKRTGVPADTIRAWERRYGVPRPQRTASGRRLYSEADLAIIRQLRERGTSAAQAAAAVATRAAPPETEAALATALRQADYAMLLRRLEELGALLSLEEWVARAARAIILQRDDVPAEAAHLAGQVLRARLIRLLGAFEREGAPVILAGLMGTDIGALAVGVLLARDGVPVLSLGECVPLAIVARLAQRLDAPALLVEGAGALDRLRGAAPLVGVIGESAPPWALHLPSDPVAAAARLRERLGSR